MSNIVNVQYEMDRFNGKRADLKVIKTNKAFKFNFDLNKKNHQTIYGLLQEGHLYEADVSNFMVRTINEGDIAVDVGANVGFYSMLLCSLNNDKGQVIAFEPSDLNASEIKENQLINNYINIDIRQKLVGDSNAKEVFYHFSALDSGTSYAREALPQDEHYYERKKVFTLDDELKEFNAIKLVKIDVEGFEVKVLKGAHNLLSNNRVRYWIVEYIPATYEQNGESLDSLKSYMSQFDYELFILDYQRGFPKLYPLSLDFSGRYVMNLLFAKMDDLANDWVFDETTKLCSPPRAW